LSAPRMVVHLHGGLTEPNSDGHALATIRPGGTRHHRYGGIQEAAHLWYHDHALGITRTNVFMGLAGHWLVRDAFDTGFADNPLGLPAGEFEVPLVLQDRIFLPDGTNSFRLATYVEQGKWEGAQAGDLAVVNGKVMPNMTVARCPYRFRLLNASNARAYELSLSDQRVFHVLGSDQGLCDAPVATSKLLIAPGERYDLVIDFGDLAPGDTLELRNDLRLPLQFQIFGDPEITRVMRFTASQSRGEPRALPVRLRGDGMRPRPLPHKAPPVTRRTMTVAQLLAFDRFPPALMNLNNLPFDTNDVELVRPGSVEQWDLVNLTTDDHPIHVHLARLRVLERQPFDASAYQTLNERPALGRRFAPSADPFARGSATPPSPWEAGYKDTVFCPPGQITRVLVEWPALSELDFDPDGPVQVASTVAGGAPTEDSAGRRAMRFNPQIQDSPSTVRGYVWHCHVIDHEDHDMMLPLRVKEGA
jgi:spore coat protein A, manganese oxidase